MKIIRWGKWDDNYEQKWYKYHNTFHQYNEEQYKCVIDAIKSAGYKFPGDYHQNGNFGVPFFDDGTPFMITQREWGMIMAKAWPEVINKWCNNKDVPERKNHKFIYVAFAWYTDELKNIYVYP